MTNYKSCEKNLTLKASYHYRPFYLLAFGIEFIIIWIPSYFFLISGIFKKFFSNIAAIENFFFIINLIGIILITYYGLYNIIQGKNQFEIQFREGNFKLYKNFKLEIDIQVEKIEKVNIIQGEVFFFMVGGINYFKILIDLKEMEEFQLIIRGKKWISKFKEFIAILEQYCDKNHIPFIRSYKGVYQKS